ncbi:MAG: hypothetical protein Q7U36_01505 [bacterium]|nr:hypothetical protein [bacterium]
MKKIIIIILSLSIAFLGLFLIYFQGVFKNNNRFGEDKNSSEAKVIIDGKFGFLRDAFNMQLEKIEETGATWFRPNFGYFVWGVMQKNENYPIDFSKTDEIVSQAQKRGMNLSVTLFPYADWDQKVNGDKCKVSANDEMLPKSKGGFETPGLPYYRCNPNDWTAYGKWLSAVVERYDGDGKNDMPGLLFPVLYYEIGNEPDLAKDPLNDGGMVFYVGTPENYAELLQKSYTAIKSVNNDTQVLIAAPAGVQQDFIKFWEKVLAVPEIKNYFDIANIHCISAPNQDKNDPISKSAEDLNVTAYKNLLANYKIAKPIWVTEAENVQGDNVAENVARLTSSVNNALKNGAEKIFFTGASFANDPMRYTSEILISEKKYYKDIILMFK